MVNAQSYLFPFQERAGETEHMDNRSSSKVFKCEERPR